MSFIDLFKEFHSDATEREFPPSARVMYDQLLYEFNARYWKEEILMSERELSRLSGLTATTTHRAVQFLCETGYIKTKKAKRGTIFKLTSDKVTQNDSEAIVKQSRSNSGATVEQTWGDFGNSNIRVRKDIEDKKIKDISVRARAFDVLTNWNSEIEELLTKLWRENNGCRVTAELLSYFQTLVEKHGLEWTKDAIKFASAKYGGSYWDMTLDYLRKRVAEMEGGSTNGSRQPNPKVAPITSKPPEYTGNEPWLNRDPNKPRKVKPLYPFS